MEIKGLVFDFDGLILDTELPEFNGWKAVYESFGGKIEFSDWAKCIGTSLEHYDPFIDLVKQTGITKSKEEIREIHRQFVNPILLSQPILPGIKNMLEEGRARGLKIGLASSSKYDWVSGHLKRLGLFDYFQTFCTSDIVEKVKPDPALYQLAVDKLGLQPHEAIAFEDSPPGITAAKTAGLYCVAIPNALTRLLDTSHADINLASLDDIQFDELIGRLDSEASIH